MVAKSPAVTDMIEKAGHRNKLASEHESISLPYHIHIISAPEYKQKHSVWHFINQSIHLTTTLVTIDSWLHHAHPTQKTAEHFIIINKHNQIKDNYFISLYIIKNLTWCDSL